MFAVLARLRSSFRYWSVARDTGYVVVGQVVGRGAFTCLSILLARELSVDQFATYNYFVVTATLMGSYLSLGLPVVITSIFARRAQAGSDAQTEDLKAVVALFVLIALVAVAAAPLYMPWLVSAQVQVPTLPIIAGALAMALITLFAAAISGMQAFRLGLLPILLGTAALLVGGGVTFVTADVRPVMLSNILFYLLPALWYATILTRVGAFAGLGSGGAPRVRAYLRVAATALPSLGAAVIFASMTWLIARTLLDHQAQPEEFNVYQIGIQWFTLVLFIPLAAGQVIFPRYIGMVQQGVLPAAYLIWPPALTLILISGAALLGAAATPLLSLVYGRNYAFEPAFVLTILAAAALAGPVTLIGHYVIAARGTVSFFLLNCVSPLIGVPLLLLAPPDTALQAALILCACNAGLLAVAAAIALHSHRATTRGRVGA